MSHDRTEKGRRGEVERVTITGDFYNITHAVNRNECVATSEHNRTAAWVRYKRKEMNGK